MRRWRSGGPYTGRTAGECPRSPTGTLIASVATLLGAERLGRPPISLPSRDSVKTVITADHPIPAAIRADLTAREALAEMTADGMLIAAGSGTLAGPGLAARSRDGQG